MSRKITIFVCKKYPVKIGKKKKIELFGDLKPLAQLLMTAKISD